MADGYGAVTLVPIVCGPHKRGLAIQQQLHKSHMPKPMFYYMTSAITVMDYSFTQEICNGTDDPTESLCSGFVNSSYPLTVVRQSAKAKILLIADSGTAGITKEALRYQ